MSGQWPPEWEDSDTGLPDEWTDADAGLDPEASAVTLFLASVPAPVLPASFEARISAAIAAEATARAGGASDGIRSAGTDDAKTTERSSAQEVSPAAAESGPATSARRRRRRTSSTSRSAAAKSRPAGSRPGDRRRLRLPSSGMTATLVVFLFIAGFVVLITKISGGSNTSSGSYSFGTPAQGTASAASGASGAHAAGGNDRTFPYEGNVSQAAGQFAVLESGTQYHQATLARQVREQLSALVTPAAESPTALTPNSSSATAEPASSSSASAASSASAPAKTALGTRLAGCVLHLTNGKPPRLVDEATYDGVAAYIIATSSRVWVVRPDCTAADPHQITSVSLSG
jgi:hypothetical protein